MESAQGLTDENVGSILSSLPLTSLGSSAAVARRWRAVSALAFSKQLLWRQKVHCCQVALPSATQVGDGFVTFLNDGGSLILAAVHKEHRILTWWHPDGSPDDLQAEVQEKACRTWPYSHLRSGVAGVVGYAGQQIAFFPAATGGRSTWSSKMQVIGRSHQNILHCGDHLFLLCHGNWWFDDHLYADVLDMQEGTYQKIDITKLRDDMAAVLGAESIQRQAVSSTRDHFVFRVSTASGAKIAGAVRIPKVSGGATSAAAAPCSEAPVSFAKIWRSGEPIADMHEVNELPVEDHLLLRSRWQQRRGTTICLLDAATGKVRSQLLRPPLASGAAAQFFADRDLGAVAVSLTWDVVCGCGVTPRGLQPPPVVVWDLSTGLVLQEFCHDAALRSAAQMPSPAHAAREAADGVHRFSVGDVVECFTGEGWQQGRVTQWDYREPDWPAGVVAPYQVQLTGEDPGLIYVPQDAPGCIRRPASRNWQVYEPGQVDVQLAIHPARRRIMIGLWQQRQGCVHRLDVSPSTG